MYPMIVLQKPWGVRPAEHDSSISVSSSKSSHDFPKTGQFYLDHKGAVYQRRSESGEDDTLIIAPPFTHVNDASKIADTREKRDRLLRLTMLIQMRDAIRKVLDIQLFHDDRPTTDFAAPWAAAQEELRVLYTSFVKKFGAINKVSEQVSGTLNNNGDQATASIRVNLREFREDPDCALVCSIEEFDDNTLEYRPTEIFDKRVLKSIPDSPHFQSIEEALRFCTYERNIVDFEYIAELVPDLENADKARDTLINQNLIYHDPDQGRWVNRDDYLSGDVRKKYATASLKAATIRDYQRNADALKAVLPEDIKPAEIDIGLGMHWIPTDVIEAFANEILGYSDVKIEYVDFKHKWYVTGTRVDHQCANHEYGTLSYDSINLLRYALNGQKPFVHTKRKDSVFDGEEGDDVDEEDLPEDAILETHLANDKLKKIKDAFQAWVWRDEERTSRIRALYNDKFNALVKKKYNDMRLALPGASVSITPHPHQLRAVGRNVMDGNTLHLHAVGAGKTFTSIMTVMEMKRLGKIKKPLFVVPNHMLHQFSRDFMRLYPAAHILTLDEDQFRDEDGAMTGVRKLRSFSQRAAAHPWDSIFITQSNFDRLRLKPESHLRMELDHLRTIEQRLADTDEHRTELIQALTDEQVLIKGRILQIAQLRQHAEIHIMASDHTVWNQIVGEHKNYMDAEFWRPWLDKIDLSAEAYFEDLGSDYVIIDEAQDYKNLAIQSQIDGVSRDGSGRAENLKEIFAYLRTCNPLYYASFLTATPIANSLYELFFMISYLRPDLFKNIGIDHFDGCHTMFVNMVESVEVAPEGSRFRTLERAEYKNIPELLRIFHSFTDIVHEEDLDLKLPRLKGGNPTIISVPRPNTIARFFDDLCIRADLVRDGIVSRKEDNMLSITTAGRLASVHPSLVGLELEEGERSKIDYMADEVAARYVQTRDRVYYTNGEPDPVKGAMQMIFSDVGVPKGEGQFSVYDDIRDKLVARGIPRDKIKFVHEYKNNRQKAQLRDECAKGNVAVLIGTTAKLGTGTNVQKRLIAQHHLDAPWRPADLIQRIGRIIRTGNQNDEVEVLRYVMEGSFDQYMWQTLERKVRFILQIIRGEDVARRLEEVDRIIVPYVEAKKAATGSDQPLLMEKIDLESQLRKLEVSRRAYEHERHRARFEIKRLNDRMSLVADQMSIMEQTIKTVSTHEQSGHLSLALDGYACATESEAEDALKSILRDFRKTLKQQDLHKLEAKIGTFHGYPLFVTAIRHPKKVVQDTDQAGEDSIKSKRYQFVLRIGDPMDTKIIFYKKDIKKSKSDTDEAENIEEAFQDVASTIQSESLLRRLKACHADILNLLHAAESEIAACEVSMRTLEEALTVPFDHEDKFKSVQERLMRINHALLRQTRNYGGPDLKMV